MGNTLTLASKGHRDGFILLRFHGVLSPAGWPPWGMKLNNGLEVPEAEARGMVGGGEKVTSKAPAGRIRTGIQMPSPRIPLEAIPEPKSTLLEADLHMSLRTFNQVRSPPGRRLPR